MHTPTLGATRRRSLVRGATRRRSLVLSAVLAVLALPLAACGTSTPAHVVKKHGLGGSSVVYVEGLDTAKTGHVGRDVTTTPAELAARFRVRLLQQLRESGLQTRDGDGDVPDEGVLVRGTMDTVDGGTTDGVQVGGQRIHCSIQLFNCTVSRRSPAYDLKITGTPGVHQVVSEEGAIAGAAEDAADQIAKFVRENP